MKVPIASDHAGFPAKQLAIHVLESLGHEAVDLGVHQETQVDYPDYAVLVAESVSNGTYDRGILICGSGQGMCITANKFSKVRAALAWSAEIAELAVRHNNANVLCLPGRYLDQHQIEAIITAWLNAGFEGGRHGTRVKKIHDLTNTQC
jgi:ribose 5-phosphate isomerase B